VLALTDPLSWLRAIDATAEQLPRTDEARIEIRREHRRDDEALGRR